MMIEQAVGVIHMSECRLLKVILERRDNHSEFVKGRYIINSDTIYVDASLELGREYLEKIHNLPEWARFLWQHNIVDLQSGEFLDKYGKMVKVTLRTRVMSSYFLIEEDYFYPEYDFLQRSLMILVPCPYAFGNPRASGFFLHRITFWEAGKTPCHGKLQMEEYIAESVNIKRLIEAKVGNLETFTHGMISSPVNYSNFR